MATLLKDATATGAGVPLVWSGFDKARPDTVYCWGSFDGATATLQASPDGETWFDVRDDAGDPVAFAAPDIVVVEMTALAFRGVVAAAGAGTRVSIVIL